MPAESNGSLDSPARERRVGAALEAVRNLLYVCSADDQTPERIRNYLKLADERVETRRQIAGFEEIARVLRASCAGDFMRKAATMVPIPTAIQMTQAIRGQSRQNRRLVLASSSVASTFRRSFWSVLEKPPKQRMKKPK
jgi:hypothetical protein